MGTAEDDDKRAASSVPAQVRPPPGTSTPKAHDTGTPTRLAGSPAPSGAAHDEEKLDEALDETFPASDPIPPGGTTAPVPPSSPPPGGLRPSPAVPSEDSPGVSGDEGTGPGR